MGDAVKTDANSKLVRLETVKVLFDGFKALDINSFSVNEIELRVVIGPNGAGKTTMCDVISGKTHVTEGHVFFGDRETTNLTDDAISALGVGRKFQTPTVFDSLTVFENMELALPGRRSVWQNLFGATSKSGRELTGRTVTPARGVNSTMPSTRAQSISATAGGSGLRSAC